MDSAERIFGGGASYLRLPVHVLYTIPAALIVRLRLDSVHFLPMIKLRLRSGERFDPGIDAASMIATRRVPLTAWRDVLGEQCEPRLEHLIASSGGYPREIVRLLQLCLGTSMEQWPLSDDDFHRVLNEVGDDYRRVIGTGEYEWLARVAVQQSLAVEGDADREIADRLLRNNVILRYLNDLEWFDIHPALRQIPGVSDEIARQQRRTDV
jgi:hypothetical protein